MRRRSAAVLTFATSVALGVTVLSPASAAPHKAAAVAAARAPIVDHQVGWCSAPSAAPCVKSAARDGVALTSSDPTFEVLGDWFTLDGATYLSWEIVRSDGGLIPADTADHFSATYDLGTTINPRVTDSYADDVSVGRAGDGSGGQQVTISGTPVVMGHNTECDTSNWPWQCPETAGANMTEFSGQVSDFEQWTDTSQWSDFDGMDSWTNIEAHDVPPQVSGPPLSFIEDLANSRYLHGSTTPFQGFYHVVLPNGFLRAMGIDDPSTLDPGGISTSIGAGSSSVTPGADSAEVDITGITFPSTSTSASPSTGHAVTAAGAAHAKARGRQLHVKRGVITPTRPKVTKGKRHSGSVKLVFTKAKPRGSHIKHYQARCRAAGFATRTATAKRSPVVVKGLSHVAYKCQVRAKAKAGYGRWSKKHRVRA